MNLKELQMQTVDGLVEEGIAQHPMLAIDGECYIWFDCHAKHIPEIQATFFMMNIPIQEVFVRPASHSTIFFHSSLTHK